MAAVIQTFRSREEWLKARTSYIGGSEASCIVGMNPYMTNVELWEIKTGRREREDISGKSYVRYGTNAEEHLRELFKLDFPDLRVEYEEHNMWTNDLYPWAHASLDGWLTDKDRRKGIFEAKTTNIVQSIQKEKWNHRIPDSYFCQLLHYFAVTGFDFAILKAQLRYDYDGDIFLNTKHYRIEREEVEEDIAYLMAKEKEFYEHIKNDTRPALVLPGI